MFGIKKVLALTLLINTSLLCHAVLNDTKICIDDEQRIFYRGEIYREQKSCVQYRCVGSNIWIGHDCPAVSVPPECKIIPANLDKPYPDCCMTVTCKNDSDDTVNKETNPSKIKDKTNNKTS